MDREPIKILFVCSMNQWRSPTAEKIYSKHPTVLARSCGTNKGARISASSNAIQWADLVIVMEQKHKNRLLANFPAEMKYQRIRVLDIPDEYQFMDKELISEISAATDQIIKDYLSEQAKT